MANLVNGCLFSNLPVKVSIKLSFEADREPQ